MTMRALSFRQPYAELILRVEKTIESATADLRCASISLAADQDHRPAVPYLCNEKAGILFNGSVATMDAARSKGGVIGNASRSTSFRRQ